MVLDTGLQPFISSRYNSLDILRGLAVIAIFVVNIKSMAAPFPLYANASLWSGPLDMTIATLQAFLIDDKWRTIFTALFGASTVLIAEKTAQAGSTALPKLYYRFFWLTIFGFIHLIGIWEGDILITYALAGFIAALFWSMHAKQLWIWFTVFFILGFLWIAIANFDLLTSPAQQDEYANYEWQVDLTTYPEHYIYTSSHIVDHIKSRSSSVIDYIFYYFILGGHLLETISIMIAGMALWKTNFLKAELSSRFYIRCAIMGFGFSIFLDTIRWTSLITNEWRYEIFLLTSYLKYFIGPAGAIGFAAIVMLWVRSQTPHLSWLGQKFSQTGKMAFTIYILSSLIGTSLFYGHGLGLFGQLNLTQLMGIVAITSIIMITFANCWLRYFRYGPLEWLWRSLSKNQKQPFFNNHMP